MARENKMERQIRETLESHLESGETLEHFTWGRTKSSTAAFLLFGAIGAAIARRNQEGFFIGLTDQRILLVAVKGKDPTGTVQSIPRTDIMGMEYKRGLYNGSLNIHLSADKIALNFDNRPWFPRAQQMAKLFPLSK